MNRILVFIFNEKIAKINSSRMQIIYLKRRNFEIYNFVITIGFTNLKLSCIMFMYRNIVIVFLWVIYFYYYNRISYNNNGDLCKGVLIYPFTSH